MILNLPIQAVMGDVYYDTNILILFYFLFKIYLLSMYVMFFQYNFITLIPLPKLLTYLPTSLTTQLHFLPLFFLKKNENNNKATKQGQNQNQTT